MQQDKKPLWKELNDKRSGGIVELENNPFWGNRVRVNCVGEHSDLTTIFVIEDYTENKGIATANAAYAVLAVNNLSILAEALERLISTFEVNKAAPNKLVLMSTDITNEALKQAKEALNRIS